MEKSLFSISVDIETLFDEIEELGGEITPEIEARLAITQEELYSKLGSYVNAVKWMDEKLDAAKKEKERIATFTKSYTNKKERLLSAMTRAVSCYGNTSKTGTKFVELNTYKLSIRKSQSAELNLPLIAAIKTILIKYLSEIYNTSELGIDDFNVSEVLEYINNELINDSFYHEMIDYRREFDANTDEEFISYNAVTEDDLSVIDLNIGFDVPLLFLLRKENAKLVETMCDFDYKIQVVAGADKTSVKNRIKDGQNITISCINENENLQIK